MPDEESKFNPENTTFTPPEEEASDDKPTTFEESQREATEEALAEEDSSVAKGATPEYSPPGTLRGTTGSNANFDPDAAAADDEEEWDPHGGEEDVSDRENYEPRERPE